MSRLHHIALGSANVERCAAFYAEVFELSEVARHYDEQGGLRSIWLDLQGALLMIEHTTQPAHWVEGVASGPFLLAFAVTPNERERLESVLLARGHRIESRTKFTSYTRDPDGNRVGFSHYPAA